MRIVAKPKTSTPKQEPPDQKKYRFLGMAPRTVREVFGGPEPEAEGPKPPPKGRIIVRPPEDDEIPDYDDVYPEGQ